MLLKQCPSMHLLYRDIAAGKYTLKQTENYGKWLSIQQTFAHAIVTGKQIGRAHV